MILKPITWKSWPLLLVAAALSYAIEQAFPQSDDVLRADPVSIVVLVALQAASMLANRFLAPKTTVKRGVQQGEVYIQNAEEGTPVAEIYGGAPDTARTTDGITWENIVNCVVNADNSLEKTAGADECYENATGGDDAGARSAETITGGNWEVTWTYGPTDGVSGRSYAGLTDRAFSTPNASDLLYSIHVSTENNTSGTPHPPNSVFVYQNYTESGNVAYRDGVWVEGDTLKIRCVDDVVTFWHKDDLLYTSAIAPVYPLRFAGAICCLNKTIENVNIVRDEVDSLGGIKTAGTVIWAGNIKKLVIRSGGKGMPRPTTEDHRYFLDLAICFGRGRLRLKKLWANTDLILDLAAAVGSPTGVVDGSGSATTSYTNNAPPVPAIANSSNPAFSSNVTTSADGSLSGMLTQATGWYYQEGNYEHPPDGVIEAETDGRLGDDNTPAHRGFAILRLDNFPLSAYGGVPTFTALLENMDYVTLEEIAVHLCERVGIEPADRDFSEFTDQAVRGLLVNQIQSPRDTLDRAIIPYGAEWYESVDGQLTGVYLGGASVVTLDQNHLGMTEGDQTTPQGSLPRKLEFTILDQVQIPRQVTVSAWNPNRDYEISAQHAYRMTGDSRAVESIQLPMTLLPNEIRQAAERILYQRHIERESAAVSLPHVYGYLDPTNIVTVVSDSVTHRLRLTQISGAVPGALDISAVADEILVYDQTIEAECTSLGVTWECDTNFAVSGSSIVKDGGDDGFQVAWAQSAEEMTASGEYFSWVMPQIGPELWVGLNNIDCPACTPAGGRCIWSRTDASGGVYFYYSLELDEWYVGENDDDKASGTYTTDSVFKFRRNASGKIECSVDDALVYTSTASAGSTRRLVALAGSRTFSPAYEPAVSNARFGYCPPASVQTVQAPSATIALLMDSVMLRDQDAVAGYYAALIPYGNGAWEGGALYKDEGSGYELVQEFTAAGTAGVLASSVTSNANNVFDETSTVTVDLYGTSATLESKTELEVLNGANAALLGDGMIFQFTTATQVGGYDNRWNLTGILWSRRGSDYAVGTHTTGDRFVLLDDSIRFIQEDLTERGIARNFKGVTSGYTVTDAMSTSFTWDCRTLQPLSVVDVQGSRDGSNNLTITWKRRTRIGGHWADGIDVPLGETIERYEVDVMDGVDILRTITVNDAQTASYTAAEQTADGLTPGDPVDLEIYQISGTIGRGFVREATV